MTNPDCMACNHAYIAQAPGGQIDFSKKVCKAVPPVPVTVLGPNGQPAIVGMFPVVGPGTFCGLFQAKLFTTTANTDTEQ